MTLVDESTMPMRQRYHLALLGKNCLSHGQSGTLDPGTVLPTHTRPSWLQGKTQMYCLASLIIGKSFSYREVFTVVSKND